jgi:hypothetical protein
MSRGKRVSMDEVKRKKEETLEAALLAEFRRLLAAWKPETVGATGQGGAAVRGRRCSSEPGSHDGIGGEDWRDEQALCPGKSYVKRKI